MKTPPNPSSGSTAPEAFFTAKELAARWKKSERSIRREIADGGLPVHRIGRSVRISRKDVAIFEAQSGLSS